jgi:hypothetical protein
LDEAPRSDRGEHPLFPLRTPEVISSLAQRSLFRWWDRRRIDSTPPPVAALSDESVVPLLSQCIFYQVQRTMPSLDFLATSHGSDVHPLFGHRLVGTLLSEHASASLLEGVMQSYRVCAEAKRPVFSMRRARDERGTPVQIEILRVPLTEENGSADAILSHFAILSPTGPFSPRQLIKTGSTEDYALVALITRRL